MTLSPDEIVFVSRGPLHLNATIVFTWAVMSLLTIGSALVTRRLSSGMEISRWQNVVEVIVEGVRDQIRDVTLSDPSPYVPFIGTLFLLIACSNLLAIVPGFRPPTGSLSTTTALALCVLLAVPFFGVLQAGPRAYLQHYVRPTPLMLPFNVIGELSRTLALAIRLYGNIMSGTVIIAILLGVAPLLFPIVMRTLGLLTGMVQAYIFAVLATVYIASAAAAHKEEPGSETPSPAAIRGDSSQHAAAPDASLPEEEDHGRF